MTGLGLDISGSGMSGLGLRISGSLMTGLGFRDLRIRDDRIRI